MRSMLRQPRSFAEFWPHYVGEHRKPLCRGVHYAGGVLAVAVFVWGLLAADLLLILLTPVAGYGPAWLAHVYVERNKPATWRYVWWSIRGEFKMLGLALRGKMADEVTRCFGRPDPSSDAPLRDD